MDGQARGVPLAILHPHDAWFGIDLARGNLPYSLDIAALLGNVAIWAVPSWLVVTSLALIRRATRRSRVAPQKGATGGS